MIAAKLTMETITRRFDEAAPGYDEAARVQAEVAQHLVDWAMPPVSPLDILDIGAGTGLVASAVGKRWPRAAVTALDSAPNMLFQAQQKMHDLKIIIGDASRIELMERFDIIFCSMLLHWLPDPHKVLQRWRGWLKTGGRLYAAFLVEGSFHEWGALCAAEGLKDGLWPMPRPNFAEDLASRTERRRIPVAYPSAMEFLRRLKETGASTPRAGHEPLSASVMRRVLERAPKPFVVSYETLYIELPSSSSI